MTFNACFAIDCADVRRLRRAVMPLLAAPMALCALTRLLDTSLSRPTRDVMAAAAKKARGLSSAERTFLPLAMRDCSVVACDWSVVKDNSAAREPAESLTSICCPRRAACFSLAASIG